jgi:hypothetical protein
VDVLCRHVAQVRERELLDIPGRGAVLFEP